MKVKATAHFDDLKEKVPRKPGDVFEVDETRFEQINSAGFGTLVEKVEEKAPARKPARKTASRKAAPKAEE